MMIDKFPGISISVTKLTRLVREGFPNVSIKRLGKKRVSYIVGIEMQQPPSLDFITDSASCSFSGRATPTTHSSITTPTLPTTITSLPSSVSLSKDTQIAHLLVELQMERDKRAAL